MPRPARRCSTSARPATSSLTPKATCWPARTPRPARTSTASSVVRPASVEGFKYGDGIIEAAAKGLVWDEEKITVYVQDPTKFLDEFTGNPKLKSKMAFKVKKEADAANVAAFLASLSPAAAAPAEGEAAPAEGEATN